MSGSVEWSKCEYLGQLGKTYVLQSTQLLKYFRKRVRLILLTLVLAKADCPCYKEEKTAQGI